ncbi:MAG: UDP-N-acetylmuramoyl-L-alanine--D-glutamate ligase [Candidatus Omnitrophota bacterium]
MELSNKNVTVLGLGKSGLAAAQVLKANGAIVSVSDSGDSQELSENKQVLKKQGINVETGSHSKEYILGRDLIVTSPGVPRGAWPLLLAGENNIPVISEIELGFWFCRAPVVAVTGTNGKSTVTSLIGEILSDAGKNPIVCGNIGNPFCGELPRIKENNIVVLEVSSFQLETIKTFRPKVSALLNVTQNHLDRHTDFKEYLSAKKRIFLNQRPDDTAVLFYDDPVLRALAKDVKAEVLYFSLKDKVNGAYLKDGKLFLLERFLMGAGDIKIKGEHNILNALCCAIAASVLGVSDKSIAGTISRFKGLEHRFEHVRTLRGVNYVNDSKATSVDAAVYALRSIPGGIILIAGGRDKKSDYNIVKNIVNEKARAVILIGEAKENIKIAIQGRAQVQFAASLEDAVKKASDISQSGDTVLLSPMCASFDMFRNFEDRGDKFKEIVSRLQ